MTTTIEIGLDTPIYQLTPRQLFELQKEWMEQNIVAQQAQCNDFPRYVNKMADLAEILGCSVSTLYRMKAEGKFDGCISQCGKWQMIDVNAIIEKFKTNPNKNTKNKRQWKS